MPTVRRARDGDAILYDPGFVYLIRFFPGVYKIGRSTNPSSRMAKLQSKRKTLTLELIHVIRSDNYQICETTIQRIFKDSLINGEYYFLTDGDVARFKAIGGA
jgi:hypothetical protein